MRRGGAGDAGDGRQATDGRSLAADTGDATGAAGDAEEGGHLRAGRVLALVLLQVALVVVELEDVR